MDTAATPTLALASELIARPSLTPDDAGCQQILATRLAALGFRCETLVFGNVTNLWAHRGDARPLVCFAGHTDVVPTGPRDAWHTDPFVPTLIDGHVHGRGAADMKGSLAAFVVAIETLLASAQPAGSLALLVTSDEEGPSVDGTARVVEELARRDTTIDYCIVGEPSSVERLGDMIKNGRRGTLSGTLVVKGMQGHIAYPHLTRNPIHLVAPALAELSRARWDDGNEYFPPTTFQCSNVHAGTGATNVVPGTLELLFNFRYSPASTRAALVARFEEILRRHELDYDLTWTGHGEPFLTPRGKLVDVAIDVIREVTGLTPELSCTGGTSDGRFIARICPQIVEIGPINASIHKLNERVSAADLETLATLYCGIAERLLASG